MVGKSKLECIWLCLLCLRKLKGSTNWLKSITKSFHKAQKKTLVSKQPRLNAFQFGKLKAKKDEIYALREKLLVIIPHFNIRKAKNK